MSKLKWIVHLKLLKTIGLDENGRVTKFLRDDSDRLMNPYIPFKEGMLRRNKTYHSNHEIKYISPYAHYMYIGKVAHGASRPKGIKRTISSQSMKYHTSGTGAKWDRLMIQRRGKDLVKDVQNHIKGG